MPLVAFANGATADNAPRNAGAFRKGLSEAGYVEGQNVNVEYHWLAGQYERLPALMADLIRRRVTLIATPGFPDGALAAKAATTTIPIVFGVPEDPVKLGLVASLSQPGGNATGINFFAQEVSAKRLGLLHELVPKATRIAVLVNPASPSTTEQTLKGAQEAARALGLQILVLNANTVGEIDAAFATLARERAEALFVAGGGFFNSRRVQFATLAARDRVPASFFFARVRRSRRADELRNQHCGDVPSSRRLQRPNSQGRETHRFAGTAINQIRVRHQPANGQGARPRSAPDTARPRRRGDRVSASR
jgi:putative ABC transport system substrate-binding protein